MAQSFNIRPPEDVAFAYGFDKNRIAQAVAEKKLDETSAVMTLMWLNAGERQKAMQAGQQPTVAQQVLGGGGAPAPLAAAPAASAGIGAPPMPPPPSMPQPEMGMPPQEMPQPEMGMAAGGLTTLPLPDTMFDEPTNGGFDDGYAGGGMVAFADGGMANLYDDVEYFESGGKQSAVSKAGARGVMQLMPGTMKDPGFGVTPMRDDSEAENRRAGREYLDAMYRRYGDEATALAAYNWGPGNVDKWLKKGGDPKQLPAETKKYIGNILGGKASPQIPERDIGTAEGRASSREDLFQDLQRRFGQTPEEQDVESQRIARAQEMASPEYYEKQRKADMWQTLAEIGVNMASKPIAEAIGAALPGARADKKERKALKDRALDAMAEINGLKRKENLQLFGMAVELGKEGAQQEQFEQKLKLDERQVQIAEKKLKEEIRIAGLTKPEDINDRVTRYLLEYAPGTPQHEAAKRVYEAKRPASSEGGAKPFQEALDAQKGAVAPGTIQDGYKFKGGDPSVANNWEKVK